MALSMTFCNFECTLSSANSCRELQQLQTNHRLGLFNEFSQSCGVFFPDACTTAHHSKEKSVCYNLDLGRMSHRDRQGGCGWQLKGAVGGLLEVDGPGSNLLKKRFNSLAHCIFPSAAGLPLLWEPVISLIPHHTSPIFLVCSFSSSIVS